MKELFGSALTSYKEPKALQKDGILFAVLDGDLIGESLVFIKEEDGNWVFFAFFDLPEFFIRKIPKKDFLEGIRLGIVEQVEELPKELLTFIRTQYNSQVKS